MRKVVVIEALRTAIGRFGGAVRDVPATELAARVIGELLCKLGLAGEQVDEVIMGNVLQAGLGQNPARQAAIKAGLDVPVPSFTVNKVCGSGLKAIELAAQAIASESADIIIAGGMENMSQAPYLSTRARWGHRFGHSDFVDSMINDGLWCAIGNCHMGLTAENIAEKYKISREEQDAFAVLSQQKTAKAMGAGVFDGEIVPVTVRQSKGQEISFKVDEHPRPETTIEKLASLSPAFRAEGTVTAGNSSGLNDGAAAAVLMSEQKAAELHLKPKATVKGCASAGIDPAIMGMGPVAATQKLLRKTGLTINDFDLIEANEAFAVQAIAVGKELAWDDQKVNVNGGAIAYGHPIGATGAKLLVNLVRQMEKRRAKLGLVTLCIGGGQGMAMALGR